MSQNNTIWCVGSANLEHIISIQQPLGLGAKNDVRTQMVSAGGSALNQSCRLLAMGFHANPILPAGDDESGSRIVEVLKASIIKGNTGSQMDFGDLLLEGKSTSISVVIIDHLGRRTILTWAGTASESYDEWLLRRLDQPQHPPGAIMVGHIPPDRYGHITRRVINHFSTEGSYILVNMGRTQYEQGPGAFLDVLEKVDCLQFELSEAKRFVFSELKSKSPSIEQVLEWLMDRTGSRSVVLTLAEAGAVACHRDAPGELLIAWPYDLEGIVKDSTGAGDAFAAGMASAMAGSDRGINQFENALAVARDWAAFACTTLGGAYKCPNQKELRTFVEQHRDRVLRAPERASWTTSRHIIRYFDITRRYSMFSFAASG